MNLQEMFMKGIIGTDALYMCHYHQLFTASDIMEHYITHGDFSEFRGCHSHANLELVAFCQTQISVTSSPVISEFDMQEIRGYKPTMEFVSIQPRNAIQKERIHKLTQVALSEFEEQQLNHAIKERFATLSVRAQNAFANALGQTVTYENIRLHIFFNPDFDFYKIRNVGTKTVPELEGFVEWVYNTVIRFNPEDYYEPMDKNDALEGLNYFDKLDVVLMDQCIGSTELRQSIARTLNLFQSDSDYYADALTDILPLSKERIRQLRFSLNSRIALQIMATHSVEEDFLNEYGLDISGDTVIISDEFRDRVNSRHGKDYTTRLVSLMMGSYLSSSHRFPGDYKDILSKRSSKMLVRYEWKTIPWIHEDLLNAFFLDNMMTELSRVHATHRDADTIFSAIPYFQQDVLLENPDLIVRVRQMLSAILSLELGLTLQEDFMIILPPNKRMHHWRYVQAALEDIGTAASAEEIVTRIEMLYPDYPLTEHQVSTAINCNRDKFVNHYRSALFMLPHFEEAQNVVSIPIRDMAYEYLCEQEVPISLEDLLAYLVAFYPSTNKESVRNNLYEDKQNRFVFFPGACIGVKEKHEHLMSVLR
jgi:hypothetical protein